MSNYFSKLVSGALVSGALLLGPNISSAEEASGPRIRARVNHYNQDAGVPTDVGPVANPAGASAAGDASAVGSADAGSPAAPLELPTDIGDLELRDACTPGASYSMRIGEGADSYKVDLVCPTPKGKVSTCAEQFPGNSGLCLPETSATLYGLTPGDAKTGYCSGDASVRCYDGKTVVKALALKKDLEGLAAKQALSESKNALAQTTLSESISGVRQNTEELRGSVNTLLGSLSEKVGGLDDKVKGLEEEALSELDRFSLSVKSGQCEGDYAALKEKMEKVGSKREWLSARERQLNDYVYDALGSDDEGETEKSPLEVLREGVKVRDERLDAKKAAKLIRGVEKAMGKYEKAVESLNQYVADLKVKGCDYENSPWTKDIARLAAQTPTVSAGFLMMYKDRQNSEKGGVASYLVPLGEGPVSVGLEGGFFGGAQNSTSGPKSTALGGGVSLVQEESLRGNTWGMFAGPAASLSLSERLSVQAGAGVSYSSDSRTKTTKAYQAENGRELSGSVVNYTEPENSSAWGFAPNASFVLKLPGGVGVGLGGALVNDGNGTRGGPMITISYKPGKK